MKTDPWKNYGKATLSSLFCSITYFVFGLDNLGSGHVRGMALLVFIGILFILVFINFLYLLPGRLLNEIRYCLPGFLTILGMITEGKSLDLLDFSNPMVGLLYIPLLMNALFGIYFFIQEMTGWTLKKKM